MRRETHGCRAGGPFVLRMYGSVVRSDWRLPFAEWPADTRPAVTITRDDRLAMPAGHRADGPVGFRIDEHAWWFDYPDAGLFRIGTSTLTVRPHDGADDRAVVETLAGRLSGLLMRRRGRLVLHANVVGKDGHAVVLAGRSGAGKTTLTRALLHRGFEFLSDDLAVLDVGDDRVAVEPGPGRLKVRMSPGIPGPSAPGESAGRGTREVAKTVEPAEVSAAPHEVCAVVVVEAGAPWAFDRLPASDAALELVRHAHMPRSLGVTGAGRHHLAGATRLLGSVSAHRLSRGEGAADLSRSADRLSAMLHTRGAA